MVTGVTILGGRSFTEVSSYLTVAGPLQATQDPPASPAPIWLARCLKVPAAGYPAMVDVVPRPFNGNGKKGGNDTKVPREGLREDMNQIGLTGLSG